MLASREPGNPVRGQQVSTGAPVDISGKADASEVASIDARTATLETQVADLLARIAVIESKVP